MRVLLLSAVVSLALVGCGSPSSLSADDQEFCTEQEDDPLAYLRDRVDEMLEDDGHWSSEGDAWAFQTVVVDRSEAFLSRNFQDQRLKDLSSGLDDSLFDATMAADEGEFMDMAVLEQLKDDLRALEDFCDEEG